MKFGMTDQQFKLFSQIVVEPLKKAGAEVFIFGSRTTSKFHSHSDVDVLFRFDKKTDDKLVSKIHEEIENSKFPFIVDLVDEKKLVESYRNNILSQLKRI